MRKVKVQEELIYHHHHHVYEELDVFPFPLSSRWSWSLHLLLGHPMFLRPFCWYCSYCFVILFVSILCTCCSHISWYCFISFTVFCAPVFLHNTSILSLSSFVIPGKCLKNFICAASDINCGCAKTTYNKVAHNASSLCVGTRNCIWGQQK